MNGRDLLDAFQQIDADYIIEAQQRTVDPLRYDREDFIMNNQITRRLVGFAAVIAVCSIAAVSVIAIKQRGTWAADSPDSAAVSAQNDQMDFAPQQSMSSAAEVSTAPNDKTTELTTVTTVSTLPVYDDIVVETVPAVQQETQEAENVLFVSLNRSLRVFAAEDRIENSEEIPAETDNFYGFYETRGSEQIPCKGFWAEHPYVYDGTEPVHWIISGTLSSNVSTVSGEEKQSINSTKMRFMLVENGKFLPFSTTKNGAEAYYADSSFLINFEHGGRADLYFHPQGIESLESVSVVMIPWAGNRFDLKWIPHNAYFAITETIKVLNPSGGTFPEVYTAQDSDYVAFPESVTHEAVVKDHGRREYNATFGISVGKSVDYESDSPDRLKIIGDYDLLIPPTLHRDEVCLKINVDDAASVPAVMVLIDDKPLKIEGKDAIAVDCYDGKRTLNYHLDLSGIPDGMHTYEVILLDESGEIDVNRQYSFSGAFSPKYGFYLAS